MLLIYFTAAVRILRKATEDRTGVLKLTAQTTDHHIL